GARNPQRVAPRPDIGAQADVPMPGAGIERAGFGEAADGRQGKGPVRAANRLAEHATIGWPKAHMRDGRSGPFPDPGRSRPAPPRGEARKSAEKKKRRRKISAFPSRRSLGFGSDLGAEARSRTRSR